MLAAADRHDDLQPIAVGDQSAAVSAPRDNIALFCCALFAGAATYLSLVEHPRLDEGEAELADTTLLASHPRPAIFQAALGVVGSLAAMLAGSAAGAVWWLAGGAVLGAAAL